MVACSAAVTQYNVFPLSVLTSNAATVFQAVSRTLQSVGQTATAAMGQTRLTAG